MKNRPFTGLLQHGTGPSFRKRRKLAARNKQPNKQTLTRTKTITYNNIKHTHTPTRPGPVLESNCPPRSGRLSRRTFGLPLLLCLGRGADVVGRWQAWSPQGRDNTLVRRQQNPSLCKRKRFETEMENPAYGCGFKLLAPKGFGCLFWHFVAWEVSPLVGEQLGDLDGLLQHRGFTCLGPVSFKSLQDPDTVSRTCLPFAERMGPGPWRKCQIDSLPAVAPSSCRSIPLVLRAPRLQLDHPTLGRPRAASGGHGGPGPWE